ncbi:DNA (cytosine-5-)-methyltransferase [Spongiimicrobium sp. 3-5]|uniref:DNA (cytosine-5-)-methyltransferase n=1 Tax=Spongiimicrobium sp. 3-5 TaxID=3332596 RepID=UPI00397FE898
MALKVVELFAGVGGFRIGLEGYPRRKDCNYEVIWSNQWEPSTKKQQASRIYKNRWPQAEHSVENIADVVENKWHTIPDHDLLVGGFPCQDYSVATSLKNSEGLIGKKGVLWWSIEAILRKKVNKPKYLLLENVDRLLKSPSKQRGRDFAVMLASLNNLGYAVEWRVINAAEYGMPQRRRRIFILAYHQDSGLYNRMVQTTEKENWLQTDGVFAHAFQIKTFNDNSYQGTLEEDLAAVSATFNLGGKASPFLNSGLMYKGTYVTNKSFPDYTGPRTTLGDILLEESLVPESFFIRDEDIHSPKGWKYLKGAKNEARYNKKLDFHYTYIEGGMVFPEALDNASRTIITKEGGKTPTRFKHVVQQGGRLRRLTPIELERLNMFPDNHTELNGVSATKRAFLMGNALVVGIIDRLGKILDQQIHQKTHTLHREDGL